jgi:hypothetical protein
MVKGLLNETTPVKMSQIDQILANPSIRSEIYKELGIAESDLPYPVTLVDKKEFIYGFLSLSVHNPDCSTLWLRENEDPEFKKYATFLATRARLSTDTFNVEEAAVGQEHTLLSAASTPEALSLSSSGKSSTSLPDPSHAT